MYDVLKNVLVDLQVRAEDISPTAKCIEVGLDSLTVVELSSVLSSRLGIEIHDYELLELNTVGDIACLMEERRIAAAGEAAGPQPWGRAQFQREPSRPTPRLRSVLDGLLSYQPTDGVYGPERLLALSANESAHGPLPGIVAAMAAASLDINRYPDPGCAELTRALARRHGVGQAQVLVGGGSVALLQALFQAVGEPGAEVVYAWRSFELYPVLADLAGVRSVRVPLTGEAHDLGAMADQVTEATRLVLICNPNNPTGTVVGGDALRAFLDRIPPTCLVAFDEAYFEYVYEPTAFSGLKLGHAYPNLVVLRTFSKAYGLAGLRVGYLVGAADVVAQLRKACLAYAVNSVAQQAALAALGLEEDLLRHVRATITERGRVRDVLLAEGWDVPAGQGNFLWLRLGEDTAAFGRWCADAGIAVRTFDGEGVRLSLGTAGDNDAFLAAAHEWRAWAAGVSASFHPA